MGLWSAVKSYFDKLLIEPRPEAHPPSLPLYAQNRIPPSELQQSLRPSDVFQSLAGLFCWRRPTDKLVHISHPNAVPAPIKSDLQPRSFITIDIDRTPDEGWDVSNLMRRYKVITKSDFSKSSKDITPLTVGSAMGSLCMSSIFPRPNQTSPKSFPTSSTVGAEISIESTS